MNDVDTGARPHLSIGEVLALLQDEFPDVTISKIRFLESQGLLDPERTPSGYRKFYDDDIARLRWILAQQRDNFLPLKVIKERLAAAATAADLDDGPATAAETAGATEAEPEGGSVAELSAPPEHDDAPLPAARGGHGPARGADRTALAEALDRRAAERAASEAVASLLGGQSDVSLTKAELAAAANIAEGDVEGLESYGLIGGRSLGRDVVYDGDALVVARLAAGFLAQGLEVRHLRMFKVAAEREAGVFEQLVTPLVRQRNPESRRRAATRLDELARLGHGLHDALLRQALRSITGT
jgi:DNA-binding transcriptional MerR regulator